MKVIMALIGTLLLSLPIYGQTTLGSGSSSSTTQSPSNAPILDPGTSDIAEPNIDRDTNTTINSTGAETAGSQSGSTDLGTGSSSEDSKKMRNPMGEWQGK